MPPRKATPKKTNKNPTVIRRVMKKVITEEVIEEIVVTPKPRKAIAKATKKPKLTAPAAKKPVASRAQKENPVSTTKPKSSASKKPNTLPDEKKKRASAKKAKVGPNTLPVASAKTKKAPRQTANTNNLTTPIKKKPATSSARKAQSSASKPKSLAVNNLPNALPEQKTKRIPAKMAKAEPKPETVASASKTTATTAKTSTTSARKGTAAIKKKTQAKTPASLSVKPVIMKARKSGSASVQRAGPSKKPRSSSTKKFTVPPDDNDPLAFAQMLNGAMVTASQAAQEEMNVLARKTQSNPKHAIPALLNPLSIPSAVGSGGNFSRAGNAYAASKRATKNLSELPPVQASQASDEQYIWELSHETGYFPDGFHSYMEPTKRNLGTFTFRAAAVQRGQQAVGSNVGSSWDEVQNSGDMETVSDSAALWEICWSPPDSEYSRVTARRISTAVGRWVVDVEQGYPPDGFHSYQEPSKKQLGPYATKALAVQVAKEQVGSVYGIEWDEVVEGGELRVIADSPMRWEVDWSPPDSEHSHVTVRMLCSPQSGQNTGEVAGSGAAKRDSDDDYEYPYTVGF